MSLGAISSRTKLNNNLKAVTVWVPPGSRITPHPKALRKPICWNSLYINLERGTRAQGNIIARVFSFIIFSSKKMMDLQIPLVLEVPRSVDP